jgi:hypothetical protein
VIASFVGPFQPETDVAVFGFDKSTSHVPVWLTNIVFLLHQEIVGEAGGCADGGDEGDDGDREGGSATGLCQD